jgi:hypothetical protein
MRHVTNNNGSALLITLALMLLLTSAALVAVNESTTDVQLSFNQMHEEQAFYLAEAGAQRALVQLNIDDDWRDGYISVAMGDGSYSVAVEDSASQPPLDDTVLIVSTGFLDGTEATVEFTTVPVYIYPFRYAMFADAGIRLDRETCTDSFNSDSGSYDATHLDSLGDVGTNGTVESARQVDFGGSISTATPDGITLGEANTVTGDTTTTADSVDLAIIPDSEFEWAKSISSAPLGLSGSGYSYNNGNRTLSMGSSSELILTSGVYYFSDILMGQDSKITLAPDAQVTIYVMGDVVFNQNSTVNDGGAPSALQVYSAGGTLQFNQGNTFYGSFYGPNAHIQYDQTTEVFGALVGNTIQLDRGACFHYDRNLANIRHGTTGEMMAVAWGEIL